MRDLLASTGWSKWVPSHDRHRIGISYGWVTSQNTRHLPMLSISKALEAKSEEYRQ